jgi:peptide/nickel transport system substrate-binding protein
MTQWRLWKLLAVGFVILTVAVLPAAPVSAGKTDDTLNIAWTNEVDTLAPYYHTCRECMVLDRHIYDTLIYRDHKTWEYKPNLATSWKWIDDKTLELELRRGVRFHDGKPLDAEDVVYTINYITNPANKVRGPAAFNWMKDAEKLGSYKIRINLKKIYPAALERLSGSVEILPKGAYDNEGYKQFGIRPNGTGPYKVVECIPGQKFVLVKNENYHKESPKGQPSISKIVVRTIPEANTIVAELMSGGIDWMWKVPPDQAEKMAQIPGIQTLVSATMRIGFLQFDVRGVSGAKPLTERKVRQALIHAIDRESLVKNLVGGDAQVIHSVCYPSQFGCTEEVVKYEYDPEIAKKLMAEAGYPDGFEIDLYAWRNRPWCEAVIGYWKKVGVKCNLRFMKYHAVAAKLRAGELPLQWMAWGSSSINDVSASTSYFFSLTEDDMTHDPQVAEWVNRGDSTNDPAERKRNYGMALRRIAEQAYVCPMWTYPLNYAYRDELIFFASPDELPRFFLAKWK